MWLRGLTSLGRLAAGNASFQKHHIAHTLRRPDIARRFWCADCRARGREPRLDSGWWFGSGSVSDC
eukprot:3861946-Prymnesium_polylepis.1